MCYIINRNILSFSLKNTVHSWPFICCNHVALFQVDVSLHALCLVKCLARQEKRKRLFEVHDTHDEPYSKKRLLERGTWKQEQEAVQTGTWHHIWSCYWLSYRKQVSVDTHIRERWNTCVNGLCWAERINMFVTLFWVLLSLQTQRLYAYVSIGIAINGGYWACGIWLPITYSHLHTTTPFNELWLLLRCNIVFLCVGFSLDFFFSISTEQFDYLITWLACK